MNIKYMKTKLSFLLIFMLAFSSAAFAYVGDAFVTPDSWSKHITANGIKSSTSGIDFGDSGTLKAGLTTRAQLGGSDSFDWSMYQYARLRLSDAKLGLGTVNVNLNIRGAYDYGPGYKTEAYERYYDGLLASSKDKNFEYRIYQANVEFNKVLPITDIDLGRIYLTTFDNYKIDGANILIEPAEYFKVNVYYGLPVSYYSNLHTQVAGTAIEIPVEKTGTRIKGEYSYFMHDDGNELDTHVYRGRIDQALNFDALNGNLYAEVKNISKATTYEAGFDFNIPASQTGLNAYIMGQQGINNGYINPYVSMYESMMGSSEYLMGGVEITQGIKDFMMIGVGYEGRFNFQDTYGDRDYHRVYGNIDLIGLIHKNNYLSLIVDYYNIAAYGRQDENQKVLAGLQMTQIFTERIEAWLGVNVMNNRHNRSPIGLNLSDYWEAYNNTQLNENTTVAYIGASYRITDWCTMMLDYSFEYADIFKSYDMQPDNHVVEFWINFIW